MPGPQVDFDAIVKQYGGAVTAPSDFETIVTQHGGEIAPAVGPAEPLQVGGTTVPGSVKVNGVPTWATIREQFKEPGWTLGDPTLDDALRRGASDDELATIARNQQRLQPPQPQRLAPPTPPPLMGDTRMPTSSELFTQKIGGPKTEAPLPAGMQQPIFEPVVHAAQAGVRLAPKALAAAGSGSLAPLDDQAYNDATSVIEGVMYAGTPLMLGPAVTAPAMTLLGVAGAWGAGQTGEEAVRLAGGTPAQQRFAKAATSAAAAGVFGTKAWRDTVSTAGRAIEAAGAKAAEVAGPPVRSAILAAQLAGRQVPSGTAEAVSPSLRPAPSGVTQVIEQAGAPTNVAPPMGETLRELVKTVRAPEPPPLQTGERLPPGQRTAEGQTFEEVVAAHGGTIVPAAGERVTDLPPAIVARATDTDPSVVAAGQTTTSAPATVDRRAPVTPETVKALEARVTAALQGGKPDVGATAELQRQRDILEQRTGAPVDMGPVTSAATPSTTFDAVVAAHGGQVLDAPTTMEGTTGHVEDTPASAAETPAGPVAPNGGLQHDAAAGRGVQSPEERAARRRARAQARQAAAAYEGTELDSLVHLAVSQGYEGKPDDLRAELADRLQAIKDVHADVADSGRNGLTLLRAVAQYGGLSETHETAQKGEIAWLKDHQDLKASTSRTNLKAPPVRAGAVRGVKGVFNDARGKTLDGMLEALREDGRFSHLESINDLVGAIREAAMGHQDSVDALGDLKSYLQSQGWEGIGTATRYEGEEGDASFDPIALEAEAQTERSSAAPHEDVLDTGETQPRLPGAEQVRETEHKTPELEAPFSLTPEGRTARDAFERDLLALREEDKPKFKRRPFAGSWERKPPKRLEPAASTSTETEPKEEPKPAPAATATQKPLFSQRAQPAPVFFSALTRAAENLKQAKGTPEQMAAMLAKAPGVKKEELDWSGVLPWIREQGGPVTRDAIVDYLRANELQVGEVMLGDQSRLAVIDAVLDALGDQLSTREPAAQTQDDFVAAWAAHPDLRARHDELMAERNRLVEDPRATKYGHQTLPGGENYRELLLRLPRPATSGGESLTFSGGHFDVANVVAHVRFKDRTDTAGRLVLFVEEVQSDWHQKGRREGYRRSDERHATLKAEAAAAQRHRIAAAGVAIPLLDQLGSLGYDSSNAALLSLYRDARSYSRGDIAENEPGEDPIERALDNYDWRDADAARTATRAFISARVTEDLANAAYADAQRADVPDAPFKTTWPELAMKRVIRYAAEHGYDRIAWTTGDQQNARYDLSKHVDSVQWADAGKGQGLLRATKDGARVINETIPASKLPDYIGKDAADKLLAAPAGEHGWREISGLDLKIGGEGMRGFYDKILPSMVNKFAKPFGARVEPVALPGGAGAGETVATTGLGGLNIDATGDGYRVFQREGARRSALGPVFRDVDEATAWIEQHFPDAGPVQPVERTFAAHGVDVTPQMRAEALAGLPLFAQKDLEPIGARIPASVRAGATAQAAELRRTYEGMTAVRIGDRDVAVLDAGSRLTPEERARLMEAAHDVITAQMDVLDDVIGRVLEHRAPGVERRGVIFDDHTYGVFFLTPFGAGDTVEGRQAAILLNSFEMMLGAETPQAAANIAYVTAVHEALHWHVGADGPAFEHTLATLLTTLGPELAQASAARIMEAYAEPRQPDTFRRSLADVLPLYAESRRRDARASDALGASRGRAAGRAAPGGVEEAPARAVRSDREGPPRVAQPRRVRRVELEALAERLGTSVDDQVARAEAAGYTVLPEDEEGTTLQATAIPGAKEFFEQDVLPGLASAGKAFADAATQLRQGLAPATIGAGVKAATTLRAKMAREAQANTQMSRAAAAFKVAFDRLIKTAAGREQAIDWWDAVQTGEPTKILPALTPAYAYMRKALDAERAEIQKHGKLALFNAFYFPQIWKFPKQEAAWIARTLAGLLGRRPFEGSKSFLKQRTYPTFREGLKALTPKGVEPISYNPVDHFLIKMREMRRFRVGREAIEDFKAMGIWKPFGGVHGAKPEGWTRIDGALGTIYGPPTVPLKEAFDPDLMGGLETFARGLGVKLARRVNIGHGGKAWGYASGDQAITTKAAGPETVLMHEIGHILDERFGLWDRVVKPAPRETRVIKRGKRAGQTIIGPARQDKATTAIRTTIKKELRALADLRHEGARVTQGFKDYVRGRPEQMANMVHAWLYAPERMKEVAPNTYWAFFNTVKEHPQLGDLKTLQQTRSVKLGVLEHAIDIGGFPETGYYAMPNDAARVFNNHLSRGLAGQSAIFDGYRWLNNTMVTGQLALSGLFHATFTGNNALFSEGGLALQELMRGAETRDWAKVGQGSKRLGVALGTGAAGAAVGTALFGPTAILWMSGYPLAAMKFVKGWKGRVAWQTEDPGYRLLTDQVRLMHEGGFRPVRDDFYNNGSLHNALEAIRTGNWPGALARTIPAMLDALSVPVMAWLVPALKTAAYLDAAGHELERLKREVATVHGAERVLAQLPQTPAQRKLLSPEQQALIRELEHQRADNLAIVREALNRVQASMDNRFGEVVYDNWFWQRWLKDLAHVTLRSPGWQAGTYKEVGGAVVAQVVRLTPRMGGGGGDGGKGPLPVGKGSTPAALRVTEGSRTESLLAPQMAWLLTMVGMTMLMNGMTHYLSTGERPHGKDWFYPKGPDGKRRSPATYMRTVISAALHPGRTIGAISAPLNTLLYRVLISNQTYGGEIIRQPGDAWWQQAYDALRLMGTEGYQPFVKQNLERGEGKAESFMGISPAPAEIERSDAENYLHDVLPPGPPRTHEQQAALEVRRDLRTALQTKDVAGAQAARETGLISRRSFMATKKAAQLDAFQNLFKRASIDQAIHAYELATPEERREVRGLLARKYHNALGNLAPADRVPVITRATAAFKLPIAAPAAAEAAAR